MTEETPERKVDTELVRKPIALFVDKLIKKLLSGEYPPDRLCEYTDFTLTEGQGVSKDDKDAIRMRVSRLEKSILEDFGEAFNLNNSVQPKRKNLEGNDES